MHPSCSYLSKVCMYFMICKDVMVINNYSPKSYIPHFCRSVKGHHQELSPQLPQLLTNSLVLILS